MLGKIAVLGGSSPFSAALVDSLRSNCKPMAAHELSLYGRNVKTLQLLETYGNYQLSDLGWKVAGTTNIKEALENASIVIHQIRYGGMDGRGKDEELCLQYNLSPDETLGPGAFQSVIRALSSLREICVDIVNYCPEAWVLNLTNPISLVSSLMNDNGVKNTVGICELPLITAITAADRLRIPFKDIEWSYRGLNHRGFIVKFEHCQQDMIPALVDTLGDGNIGGITRKEISELHAIPTKYFRLLCGDGKATEGRANYLSGLRNEIVNELSENPFVSPPSLQKRHMEWYPESVVPMISALISNIPTQQVVNVPGDDGVVEEGLALVSNYSIKPLMSAPVRDSVRLWIDAFMGHEKAMLRAIKRPTITNVEEAFRLDPILKSRSSVEIKGIVEKIIPLLTN